MDQEPDVLKRDIDATRDSMTWKLQRLEDRVRDTADEFKGAVDETVGNVKHTLDDSVETVRTAVGDGVDNVKQAFDLNRQVNERPWVMLGGAAFTGFVLGALLGGDDSPEHHEHREYRSFSPTPERERNVYKPQTPGMLDEFSQEINTLRTAAVHTVGVLLTDWLKDMVPQFGQELAKAKNQQDRPVGNGHAPERNFNAVQDAGYTGPGRTNAM